MRRMILFAACSALFSTLALAESWTGRLVDANCSNQDKTAKECDAGSGTTAFLLVAADGKAYQLDQAGNQKIVDAMKNRADRSANPNVAAKTIMAKVSGDKDGDTIKVTDVQIQ